MSSSPDHRPDTERRKRRRLDATLDQPHPFTKWRSPAEQTAYSSKLFEALRHVRRRTAASTSPSTSTPTTRIKLVRDTADKTLAIAARGRSRWSRSILSSRLKIQLKNHKKARIVSPAPPPPAAARKSAPAKKIPPLQRRVKILGGLVPGCQKLSFPNLLEETTDYIAALEMQIKAMSALADLLTGAGSSRAGAGPDRRDLT